MSLIVWNWIPQNQNSLLLLANKDDFFDKQTKPIREWGSRGANSKQDQLSDGAWFGLGRNGRFAALTERRSNEGDTLYSLSLDQIVMNFIESDCGIDQYITRLKVDAVRCKPFNLIMYADNKFVGFESDKSRCFNIPVGIGGVSNANFDTPWPKLVQLKVGLRRLILKGDVKNDELLKLLRNTARADYENLPDTGISREREHALSSIFVKDHDYGTRSSLIVRRTLGSWRIAQTTYDGDSESKESELEI